MPTIGESIARNKSEQNTLINKINNFSIELDELREQDSADTLKIAAVKADKARALASLADLQAKQEELQREKNSDDEIDRRAASSIEYRPGSRPEIERSVDFAGIVKSERSATEWLRQDGTPATVARGQKFADHPALRNEVASRSTADASVIGTHGSFGQLVRAISTTGASAVIPTVWASNIIDLARANSATIQAGASIVPMDAKTVQIGRLTGDPTAAFRTEGSTITPSDATFDNVTLTAKTMSTLVVASMEWLQDATPDGEALLENAIASALAQHLDLVALYGGIESGAGTVNLASPPNPDGLLAALLAFNSASQVLGATAGTTATNGTSQTALSFYNELIDLVYRVRNGNETPTGLIWSPRAEQLYAKAYDSTGQPLRVPEQIGNVPQYTTTQIPTYTQGSLTTATDVFAGDWSQLLLGQRLDISIQVLTERYAESGQVGIVAHWRGDVAVARPKAFAAFKALKGA